MSRHAAQQYLHTPAGAPWTWDEEGRVLAWNDGSTLAFREEIELILRRLAPHGLPPFASLVVLLAACRAKIAFAPPAAPPAAGQAQLLLTLRTRQQQQAEEQFARLQAFPAELLARPAGKATLAEAIFERQPRLSGAESDQVLLGLAELPAGTPLNGPLPDAARFDLEKTAFDVAEAVRPHTGDSLLRRLRTGLDAPPAAAPELELPRGERVRRLMEALRADESLVGLARAICDLTAALRLPKTLVQATERTGGGASDIGNRGPLDRLLLSELAHDDLTLATRVALSEALYLHREPPAHRPRRTLAVLLDTGIRMWGVPRVLGTAAALALITRQPEDNATLAWRAAGRHVQPVDLLDKKELETHLAQLSPDLNPAAALPVLQQALADRSEIDLVLVTHRDALGDPGFPARLAQLEFDRGFLLLVERDGVVQLHALPWGSPRPLAQATVNVAKLFPTRPHRPVAPLLTPGPDDFPAIFRVSPFPLLQPVKYKVELAIEHGEGGVCVTSDRRLLAWEKRGIGARQLATDLPAGKPFWLHRDRADRVILLKGRGGDGCMSVTLAAADGTGARSTKFTGPHTPRAAWLDGEMLLIALYTRVVAVDLGSGDVRGEAPIPETLLWLHGRYFSRAEGGLAFVSWQGGELRWDSPSSGRTLKRTEVLTAFDRDGIGAWVVTRDGRVLGPSDDQRLATGFPVKQARISPSGRHLSLSHATSETWHIVDLNTRTPALRPVPGPWVAPVAPPPTRTLQNRFAAIAGAPGQPLRLRTTRGRWLEIFRAPDHSLQLVESKPGPIAEHLFGAVSTPARFGCNLHRTRWPGGSVAWLDNRGLLHLRSPDASIPEITLTLCFQAALAGWCSDGARTGPAFYLGPDVSGEPARVLEALNRFCAALC